MRSAPIFIALVFFAALNLFSAGYAGATSARAVAEMGFSVFGKAPEAQDFDMRKLDGSTLHLADLKGRVILMNFWRRNCRYCEREKKLLRTMMKKVRSADLTVLCVNLWDAPRWVKRYAGTGDSGLLFATGGKASPAFVKNEVRGKLMGYYVINSANEAVYEVKGFPTTYVIDKDGKVVAGHLGMAKWDNPTVSGWISQLAQEASREMKRPAASATRSGGESRLPRWLDGLLAGPAMQGPGTSGSKR